MNSVLKNKRICVTGANGFVGQRLVRELLARGCHVVGLGSRRTCQMHIASNEKNNFEYVACDLTSNNELIAKSLLGCEFVFQLAAVTRSHRPATLVSTNASITRNVLQACAHANRPPIVVYVSSLAACGPGKANQLIQETDSLAPRSYYGKSKSACEAIAAEFADELEISIIRPPIVLGPGDPNGLLLFKTINRWHRHLVPGSGDDLFSVIHVDDLVNAMICVANKGRRLNPNCVGEDKSQGVYFASADEVVTYSELGQLIGVALGVRHTKVIHVPAWIVQSIGFAGEILGRISSKAGFLNRDKMRDVLSGSWACSNEKIKSEAEFRTARPLRERLAETESWYRNENWL